MNHFMRHIKTKIWHFILKGHPKTRNTLKKGCRGGDSLNIFLHFSTFSLVFSSLEVKFLLKSKIRQNVIQNNYVLWQIKSLKTLNLKPCYFAGLWVVREYLANTKTADIVSPLFESFKSISVFKNYPKRG